MEQVYGVDGIGDVSFMQLLHVFWSTREALGEEPKEAWVRVKLNLSMSFISDITNQENEECDSDIDMFEVKVYDVGTLKKILLAIWWHVNTCAAEVIRYFN